MEPIRIFIFVLLIYFENAVFLFTQKLFFTFCFSKNETHRQLVKNFSEIVL